MLPLGERSLQSIFPSRDSIPGYRALHSSPSPTVWLEPLPMGGRSSEHLSCAGCLLLRAQAGCSGACPQISGRHTDKRPAHAPRPLVLLFAKELLTPKGLSLAKRPHGTALALAVRLQSRAARMRTAVGQPLSVTLSAKLPSQPTRVTSCCLS